jgi:diaminohydroxyphosphoribosylaminopyrimidine deaminase / 5-amino-6-(5-phosphoribosylamino)uracil reductase
MTNHGKFMQRCIEIARMGAGRTAPNPLVGCVIAYNGRIIGEGYHIEHGGPHAEVNAIRSVKRPQLLRESTLYVSLEPCSHHGKTPPCSDLILDEHIPQVVVGTEDPFAEVAGKGIKRLRDGGVQVVTDVLKDECRWLNRRFFTFHEKRRPYIILKWAQTPDGFIDVERDEDHTVKPTWISGIMARTMVHKCRTEEGAILVGTNTVLKDNPSLTARDWSGRSPVRLVIDRHRRLSPEHAIFDGPVPTIVFTENMGEMGFNPEYCRIDFNDNVLQQILAEVYNRKILSVIVEGGAYTLQQFIANGLWDEAHIYSGTRLFFRGVKAPSLKGRIIATESLDSTTLTVVVNPTLNYRF